MRFDTATITFGKSEKWNVQRIIGHYRSISSLYYDVERKTVSRFNLFLYTCAFFRFSYENLHTCLNFELELFLSSRRLRRLRYVTQNGHWKLKVNVQKLIRTNPPRLKTTFHVVPVMYLSWFQKKLCKRLVKNLLFSSDRFRVMHFFVYYLYLWCARWNVFPILYFMYSLTLFWAHSIA